MSTLTDFRAAVSAKIGLENTSGGDQPLIDGWVNEGVVEVIVRSRCKVSTTTLSLVAGTSDYTLATTILAMNEIYNTDASSSVLYRMNRVSPDQIINFRVGTQNQGAPPVRFYALNGASLLMVYPTPAAADVLTFYYVPRPATLSTGSDTPSDIPAEWHKTVEYYACWQAGQFSNDGASQNGNLYRALYEDELRKFIKAARQRGGRKMSPAVVGRKLGSRYPIGQPSQQDV